ncbi:SCO4848 family membrane protein [Arthrobacter sulfonylureivorans]|uniref:SCO4848 family membrane protein n=1 Tax=Arthrobacter sulfonylureivorans TaxID=2486855 RepID=UPI0039E69163
MSIPAALAWVLILAGLWALLVWVPHLIRVSKDPRSKDEKGAMTRYFTMEFMKATTSMILGIATLVIGARGLAG